MTLLVILSVRAVEFYRCEMEKFIQLGDKFGLEGETLLAFVHEQQELEREEKPLEQEKEEKCKQKLEKEERAERQRRKEEEREERHRRQDEEREARHQEREIRKLEMEAEIMRQKEAAEIAQREHELELARIAATNGDGCTAERDDRAKVPKLPAFVDGKDDLDTCLQSFERFAATAKWHKTGWHQSSVLCCQDEHSKYTHAYLRKQQKIMTR